MPILGGCPKPLTPTHAALLAETLDILPGINGGFEMMGLAKEAIEEVEFDLVGEEGLICVVELEPLVELLVKLRAGGEAAIG